MHTCAINGHCIISKHKRHRMQQTSKLPSLTVGLIYMYIHMIYIRKRSSLGRKQRCSSSLICKMQTQGFSKD